nr:PKD domain-containing protein [uncultured Albidiferax sp.]
MAYADHVPAVDGGNATFEITQQIFGSAAELVRSSANPVLSDVRAQRTLTNNAADALFAGNAQLLDTDVSVVDTDSVNLDGGTLVVNMLSGGSATDVLGIRNQGSGNGQVGVSGSNVTYSGVVIGSFTGGGAGGATLTITFNANALTVDIRAVVQNITYQNTAPPAGTTSRTIGLRLTDGDGGASDPSDIEVLIQNSFVPPTVFLDDIAPNVSITETQAQAGVRLDDSVQLNYAGATGFLNGHLVVSYLSSTNRPDDQITVRNQGTGVNQVSRVGSDVLYENVSIGTISGTLNGTNGANLDITFKATATDQAIERVIENLVYTNPSAGPLADRSIRVVVTDGAGASSTARDVDIHIDAVNAPTAAVPLLAEQQINTFEAGQQTGPAVGRLQGSNNGSYVVTWTSQEGQDGSGYGVFAQRYAANGAAIGPEFQVNSQTLGNQTEAAVTGLANGGYVIVWRADSQDGSGSYGVYGQRYAANGSAVGSEFRANTTTTGNQYEPAVLGLSDGSFVVAYRSDYSNAAANYTYDVLAQRFDASGNAVGAEITLNASGGATQYQPQLSALTGGGYVAIWTDTSGDANGSGVVAQVFNNDGSKVGSQIAVNTSVTGSQTGPDVVGLAGGGFVAVWEYSNTVYMQRFTAAGAAVGGEITVNTADSPANQSDYVRVAALETGGFIVAWDGNPSNVLGGSGADMMTQQFDASGNRIDGVRVVNSTIASTQYLPDIVGLTGNNAVVVWAGYNQERDTDSTYGVFQQILGTAGSLATSSAPVLVDMVQTLSFDENLVNATPQTIDAGVSLTDSDSTNFDGGRLWVSTISGYGTVEAAQLAESLPAQDQFGIRNQGNGAGQVGVAGTVVRYGNVVIGSIETTGANGTDLVVLFNASASAQAVEAVIENLTYANTSSAPVASRTVSISVSDGDGGTSIPRTVTINVDPDADGAQALFGNENVNTYLASTKSAPDTAALSDGGYITTWVSVGQDGWDNGVYAQRYDSHGVAVGAEFRVNSTTAYNQTEPSVIGLTGGGYVVAWTSTNQDGSDTGIYAQRFANDGTLLGAEFRVNTETYSGQSNPSLAATSDGGFVVGWQSDYYEPTFTEYRDIYFQRYNAAGVAQGTQTQANPTGEGTVTQSEPSFVGLAGGGFVALWTDASKDGNSYGVYGQRFDASGAKTGASFLVNTFTTNEQFEPSITALNDGGFVAVWTSTGQDGSSYGVFGQRYSSTGTTVGSEFRVNTSTSSNQYQSTVASLSHGGFVVTWNSNGTTMVQQFDASGARIDGEVRVDTLDNNGNVADPTVVGLANGGFVVTWPDYDYSISQYEIYQQVFGNPATLTRQANPQLVDVSSEVTFLENSVNAAPQLIDAQVGLTDLDSANFAGGMLEVNYLTGYDLQNQLGLQGLSVQDQLGLRNEGSGAGQVGIVGNSVRYGGVEIGTITSFGTNGSKLTVLFNAQATADKVEQVVESITYANTFSDASLERSISIRVSDGDGGASVSRAVTIHVTPEYDAAQPLFSNEQVNTFEPDTQNAPAMALLSDGSYLTVWTSDAQDGWGYGVYGQRFAANGVPIGTEFQINTYTPTNQTEPTVIGLTGGGYVVAWTSADQDGSAAGIYAQRFANDGSLLGDEFLVNAQTYQGQSSPSLAATADGGFVVGWQSDYYDPSFTEYRDIFFQRFNAAGVAQGSEVQANPMGEGTVTQSQPHFVGLAGGGFVAVWTDDSKDGSSQGIYGQRFDATGVAAGTSFLVNTFTESTQFQPSIAALNNGGFVVVWTSVNQDGSSYGVYGQRYSSNGTAVGSEFRVNNTTTGNQSQANVAALSTGGFVVTWESSSHTIAQQFDASGARLDGELRVDTIDNNANGSTPVVLGLANGAFVVSFPDYNYTTNTYNVYQQVYGNPAQILRQANPELVDVSTRVTFTENLVNAAPQLIDAGVGLTDADSSNFAGGILEVNYLTDYGAQDQLGLQGLDNQDQLGIRHQGSGAHQVGVAGNVVSYGGTAIGTISNNGANGGKLTVQFNASATADAVEHVIENLTYANTVSNPIASRTISIRVTDGDGGASVPRNVEIVVIPEIDGAVRFGLEKVVNTTITGAQQEPSIAHLSDGGYVVVWQDENGADGSSNGVYGQRYDANDNAVGAQFRANTFTAGNQYEAQVTGLNGGGFVVVWRSDGQDGGGAGVYGQRYNAAGVAQGTEFRVNTATDQSQYQPTITATADGGFVVGWYDNYYTNAANTEYADIMFQRFNATGVAQGVETRANPTGEGTVAQYEPSITALAGGGFMTVWTDASKDGSGSGIYGQRFTALGVAAGPVLQINSYITTTQDKPSVAGLKDGGFITVWESEGQDLSGTGIYAQRFDATGAKVGTEFRVNTHISSTQSEPTVSALENGGWVVGWSDNSNPTGSSYDVFVQQYNALGQAVDGETLVNTYTPHNQFAPSITSMADGGFVVAYTGLIYSSDQNGDGTPDGGNDTYEIRTQRFSNTAPNVSNVSANGQEDTVLVLTNTLFEGGFVDPDGQSLQAIKIINLSAEGTLRLNGVAVTTNQEISLADLQAGALTYQGRADYFGADQFRWTGSDGITFASTPVFTNILLSNVNDGPRLGTLTNATSSEGSFFSRTLAIGDPDPEGHLITVNWGDGSANSVFSTSSAAPQIQHVYADNGNYNVSVTVNDQQGQANSIESTGFSVAVANVAPTIGTSGNTTVQQNVAYTLDLGGISDPGTDTVDQYTINWGDGSAAEVYTPATLPANGILTHTYTTTGDKAITVGLRDEDGTYATAGARTVTVSAPAEVITVNAGSDITVNEGTTFTKTINFTDATDQGPAGRTYTAVWGDGQTSTGSIAAGATSVNISHSYADNSGPYTVDVTVHDNDGVVLQSGSDSFVVNVNNVAPTVGLSGAGSLNEGGVYTLTLNPSDLGTDTIAQYNVQWGDGQDQIVLAANLPANRQLTHTYADGSVSYTIKVDVVDEDGVFVNVGTGGSLTVFNVAPTAPVTGANTVAEGSVYTLNVGAVTDPGQDTRTGYSVNWGDGTPSDNFTPAQWAAVQTAGGNLTHTFADGAGVGTPRTVTVTASDEDGTFVLGSKILNVTNVDPNLVLGGNAATNEGASYTLAITGTDAAGTADPLGYSIDWGDGSAVQTLTAAQLLALSGNVSHTFADDQDGAVNSTPRTISVTANDGDGGVTTQTKVVNVNNVAPLAAVSGAATVNEASVYTLTVGLVTEPGTDTRTGYTIAWGDGNTSSFTPAQWAAAAGSFTHTYADNAAATITVSATDEDGTFVLGTQAVTINNVAPTAQLTGAASTNEGASYSLNIVGSDVAGTADLLTYSIDWNDGSAVQVLSAAQLLALSGNVTHTFADDQDGAINSTPRTISVTANDGDGGSTTATRVVNVNNVAPTLAATGASTVETGQLYTLNLGAITDPGQDTVASYSIDWGDGSAPQVVTTNGNVIHTFATAGARTVAVSLTDEDGTYTNVASVAVTVGTPPATISIEAGADTAAPEGSTFTRSINFADGTDNGAAGWSYSIDYGDGSAAVTGTTLVKSIDLSHLYTDGNATRNVSVTVTDIAGETATDSFQVVVNNVAPTATVSGASSVDEASAYTLNVGAITEPGADTRTGYTIAWGDGNTSSFTPAQWAAAAGSFTHTYADNAAATITVSATDEDGTFVLGTQAVTINNVAPTALLTGAASTNEGASYSLNIVGSDVAGAADPLGYSIDWGDGSAVQTLTAVQLAALASNVTHTFADDADGVVNSTPRTISVTANDGDGGVTTQTKVVNVNNVAPLAVVSGAATVNEASVYTLTVGLVTEPGTDTRTGYTIAWGDGNTSSFTPAQWAAAAGSFTHTFADNAAATITVSATDEDGTFVLGTQAVTINNVAPTAQLTGAASTNEGASYSLNIVGNDVAGAADPLSYSIDWNDGSAVQTLTAVQLAALAGNVSHTFADDQDGAVNSTPRTISVTANDGDGGTTTATKVVNVNNVAPTIAVTGAATIETGQTYTLNLGAITDPGQDTVSSYSIDWGDGSAPQVVTADGNVTHSFATAGARTVQVSLTDEDGTYTNVASVAVTVGTPPATVSVEAGADAALNEGATFSRTIAFTDGTDNGAAGWSYSINYGDGSAAVTGTTLVKSINLSHLYTDGTATRTATVTVTDITGEASTDSFQVVVNNVVPTATVSGASSVLEASVYTLSVGAISDPGADTRTGYTITWGDGNTSSFTPAQWAAAAGSFTHTYADNAAATITVSATDEDGTFVLGTQAVTINNVAPTAQLTGAASTNEGASYSLNIVGNDVAGAADPLSYSIDWNDGSAVQTLTAVQLAALAGNVSHTFADDQDGAVNSTPRTISVTANDGDGGSTTATKVVNVNNVAPVAAVSGATTATAGSAYTLNVGALTDPGTDVRSAYSIDWGDGSSTTLTPAQWAAAAGSFSHTFGSSSPNPTIVVTATDEDGSFTLGSQQLTVGSQATETLRIGGGPDRQVGAGGQWAAAWGNADVAITHKLDYTSALEAWSAAKFTAVSPQLLAGGDIYAGDLGVSGQSMATSAVRQEIDGKEGLRFTLTDPQDSATDMTLYLSRLFAQDDGGAFVESGRVRLLDAAGTVVGESVFHASNASGQLQVTLSSTTAFTTIELSAGVYDGSTFVYGGYALADGSFGSGVTTDGSGVLHGSDFLVDAVEFKLPVLGVPPIVV